MSTTPKKVKSAETWYADFLVELRLTANVSKSAAKAGVDRTTAYRHRKQCAEFRVQWSEVVNAVTDDLEQEAIRRAKDGVEEPVFYQGIQCGSVRKFSDTMLIFMLKARRPHIYANLDSDKGQPVKPVEIPQARYTRVPIRNRIDYPDKGK